MDLAAHVRTPAGRGDLITRLDLALRVHGRAALTGPAGIGRTVLADAVAARAADRGEFVLRLAPAPDDGAVPGTAAVELLLAVSAVLDALPAPQRAAARGLPLAGVLRLLTDDRPVLLVVDDAQWLDPESVTALRAALRPAQHCGSHPTPRGLRVLVTERGTPEEPVARTLCDVTDAGTLDLPPLDAAGIAELLDRRRLPSRLADTVHRASGGNPGLALAVGRALAAAPGPVRHPEALPLSDEMRAAAHGLLAEVSPHIRHTLLRAALATRPTAALLRRSGAAAVDRRLQKAQRAGLITVRADGTLEFAAGAVRATLAADAEPLERAACHTALADAVQDPVESVRHRALVSDAPDVALAAELTAAASGCRRRGNRALAAELGLLAAELTPTDCPAAGLARLVAAAADAGCTGRPDLARRAADGVLARNAAPADRVRARLAIADTAGQCLAGLDGLYARALEDAAADPALRASVQLRLTWKYLLLDGDPAGAREAAVEAESAAASLGDQDLMAMALTARARMGRILGDPDAEHVLARAQALESSVLTHGARSSAHILAIRHAIFDDRLAEARARLLALLPSVERAGMAEDVVEVVRSLAEAEASWGRCAMALFHARRALALSAEAGLSPGPAWYSAALAESAGGSFQRAADHARRGIRSSEEEQDQIFLCRNLHALGRVQLITGRPARAVRTLERIREQTVGRLVEDPSVLRWREDLAEALVATGDPAGAAALIAEVRPVAERLGRTSVLAALDRAHGLQLAATGDAGTAAHLLDDVITRCAALELPLEQGRTLLAAARVEHARGRPGAAAAAHRAAVGVFTRVGAAPWLALAAKTPHSQDGRRITAAAG